MKAGMLNPNLIKIISEENKIGMKEIIIEEINKLFKSS
jgi:hypothetical protein